MNRSVLDDEIKANKPINLNKIYKEILDKEDSRNKNRQTSSSHQKNKDSRHTHRPSSLSRSNESIDINNHKKNEEPVQDHLTPVHGRFSPNLDQTNEDYINIKPYHGEFTPDPIQHSTNHEPSINRGLEDQLTKHLYCKSYEIPSIEFLSEKAPRFEPIIKTKITISGSTFELCMRDTNIATETLVSSRETSHKDFTWIQIIKNGEQKDVAKLFRFDNDPNKKFILKKRGDLKSLTVPDEYDFTHFELNILKKRPRILKLKINSEKDTFENKKPDKTNKKELEYHPKDYDNVTIINCRENMFLDRVKDGQNETVLSLVKTNENEFFLNFRYPIDILTAFGVAIGHLKSF